MSSTKLIGGDKDLTVEKSSTGTARIPQESGDLTRIRLIENRLAALEAQTPIVCRLTEAIVRVADHLAPPASSIVGSKYIADRLGCTTAWIGKMAFRGLIPRRCIVAGSGGGRFWKFYRQQIDEWLQDQAGGSGT